jgi:hypothetical protein
VLTVTSIFLAAKAILALYDQGNNGRVNI